MFQIVNGVNLLTDIPAKPKKPSLYATQIRSHQFTDDEMANGCVEPKNPSGEKTPLNQEKINLLKSKFAHNTCNYMGKYVHGEKYNLRVVWKNLDSFLLITECIKIKYGEKALRAWPEMCQSLN